MEKLSDADIERNVKVYKMMSAVNNPDFWYGTHKEDNYNMMIKIANLANNPIKGAKCLDIGCGTGDLSKFLRQFGISEYLGIDIYEPSLTAAKEKYPSEKFLIADVLQWDTEERFDFVFCSGALSTNLASDNYDFMESMLKKMWSLAKAGISFNFLTDRVPAKDSGIFHYSIDKVLAICRRIIGSEGRVAYESYFDEVHFYLYRAQ